MSIPIFLNLIHIMVILTNKKYLGTEIHFLSLLQSTYFIHSIGCATKYTLSRSVLHQDAKPSPKYGRENHIAY